MIQHVRGLPRKRNVFAIFALGMVIAGNGLGVAQAAGFANAAAMNTGRSNHTATLLPNGKILVTGGIDSATGLVVSSTAVYDPQMNSWAAGPNLAASRQNHTATLLPNGKVLVVGGSDASKTIASAELYDPVTNSMSSAGNLTTSRHLHTETILPDGRVLVIGGQTINSQTGNSVLASTELYNPAVNTWTSGPNLITPRIQHTATGFSNGDVLITGGINVQSGGGIDYLGSSELFTLGTNAWTAVGSLANARRIHSATLLPSGKVLVVGGTPDGASGLSSTELYDPASKTWIPAGNLGMARYAHSATLLPNGQVFVAYGYNTSELNTGELYNPASNLWTTISNTAPARTYHTATLLPNGLVLTTGGYNGARLANAELYDPTSGGGWSAAASMSGSRYSQESILLPDGSVLVSGGDNNGALNTAEIYNPIVGTWSTTGSLVTARSYHTITLLPNGKVLVTGGRMINLPPTILNNVEIYDPMSRKWSTAPSLAVPRVGHTATLLPNGKVLIVGGGNNGGAYNSVEIYDPSTNSWIIGASMANARSSHTATLLPNGKVLVVGGSNGSSVVNNAELYDSGSDSWIAAGSLSTARTSQTATLLADGRVLIAAGVSGSNTLLSSSEIYDPNSNIWVSGGVLATPRYLHSATLLPNGKVLVTGGTGSISPLMSLSSTEIFDPVANSWSAAASLITSRFSPSLVVLTSGRLLITGGEFNNGVTLEYLNSAELYDPGLGYTVGSQPVIASATSPLALGSGLVLSGSGFRGLSEASGGSTNSSATNYPLVQLRSLVNDQTLFLTPDAANPFSATSYTSKGVSGFPLGYAAVTVFVNGVPSNSVNILVNGTQAALAATTTAIQPISPATAVVGQSVTVPFTVTSLTAGTISGNVIVGDGTTSVIVPVASGSATLAFSTAGAHTISAQYQGDGVTFAASIASVQYSVDKGTAKITLGNLNQLFDGTPKSASATTVPANLPVTSTYNGSTTLPTAIGTYTVSATINDANYSGSATGTLAIQAKTAVAATNALANFSSTVQPVTLTATVTSTFATINDGTITFQLLDTDGVTKLGAPAVSGTLTNGSASVSYLLPGFTLPNNYTIRATYNGGKLFASSSDSSKKLAVLFNGNPPSITAIVIERNPVRINVDIHFSANAISNSGLPIQSYEWRFFDINNVQVGTTLTGNPVVNSFKTAGTFIVTVVASDGVAKSSAFSYFTVTLDPNPGASAPNVFNNGANSPTVTNPDGGLGIAVESSVGGAVHFDSVPGVTTAARDAEAFVFLLKNRVADQGIVTDPNAVKSAKSAAKYQTTGISIVELNATSGPKVRKVRIMVPVGQQEVDPSNAPTDTRIQKGVMSYSVTGTLALAKTSTIQLSQIIELSAGLTLDQMTHVEFGLSNLHTKMTISTKGKVVTPPDDNHFSKVTVRLPKVDKSGKTAKGATMTLIYGIKGTGKELMDAGLDTDGVVPSKTTSMLKLQFGAIIAGMTYQANLPVQFTPHGDFGNISSRFTTGK